MAEDELQQPEPGPSAVEMATVRQSDADSRVEILEHRAAAWRVLHGVKHSGIDAVKLVAHAGKQLVPASPERARRFRLAMVMRS